MTSDQRQTELDGLTERIIGCAFEVSNTLGCGFLERIYENALAVELRRAGLRVEQQKPFSVRYKGEIIGEHVLDLLVEGTVIVEAKAMDGSNEAHGAQCLNYLKGTGLPICLLMNFGTPKLQLRRFVRDF